MMSTDDRLVYMANQIARNFEAIGHDKAAAATADHIASFWDPRMKARIFALADAADAGLAPASARAVAILKAKGAPQPQTHATEFGTGHDDAG